MKKVVIGVFIFICMFFSIDKVLAGRGCCSHHGGQDYCSGGRWVCNDGTYSPTCTCSGGAASGGRASYRRSVTTTIKKFMDVRIVVPLTIIHMQTYQMEAVDLKKLKHQRKRLNMKQ